MYTFAYRQGEAVFYFDAAGNKYVAKGGSLAWRFNNPGLVRSHSHFSYRWGAIGHYGLYAIFPHPLAGHQALEAWLHSKKYFNSSLKSIALHYSPEAPEEFLGRLSSLTGIPTDMKVESLKQADFQRLLLAIEKLCGYSLEGSETFLQLPKIMAKIENSKNLEDCYLLTDNTVLSKAEAMERILSHQLDSIIVHEKNGGAYLRSRPNHCTWHLKMHAAILPPSEGEIEPLVRVVGTHKADQCTWAFINGIDNTREEALASTELISQAAGGERVLSMPNDTLWWPIDFLKSLFLKSSLDTPMIFWTVKFLRYLLAISLQTEAVSPIILFVHSQGAIYVEHALEHLKPTERNQLRIFTFGGGSFLVPGKSHPDSHNYASAADFVCRFSSSRSQLLALERFYAHKEGLNDEQIIARLATGDAMLHLDSIDLHGLTSYVEKRKRHYEGEFAKICNLTILEPDPGSNWKHTFTSHCYQKTIASIVKKYQNLKPGR